ncbi:MAG: penicillin-binding protein activator [Candidatus Marinimicrobia bacterium]|nr:penicillin-binding protein activator [Candidatus Neomarinimicrobiota bacterium]MCF7839985.1 penicillin-binding protein activator [Candidatus Neomarinimicrobiota bacterium]MCF7902978.1 penicillin-binding protein activator [Candidatus Neomarinimicrobiota bacterium]
MQRFLLLITLFATLVLGQQSAFDRGVRLYNQGEYWQALVQFSALANQTEAQNPQLTASLLMRMKCYAKLEAYQRTMLLAREFQRKYPDSRYLVDVSFLLGEIYSNQGDFTEAAWNYAQSRMFSERKNLTEEADRRTRHLVLNLVPLDELSRLYTRDIGPVGQFLNLLSVERLRREGKSVEATDLMFNLRPYLKKDWLVKEAIGMDWKLSYDKPQTIVLGVMLPLSGSLSEVGTQILAGLRYAAMTYSDSVQVAVELDVRDNGASLGSSIEIARDFAENPRLIATIGPLISDNVKAVAAVLDGTGKILLTPTATENDLVEFSDLLYQYQPNRAIRGAALAAYAVNTLGLHTFAVIAPTDAYGRELTDSFTKKVDDLGGQVLYEGWYAGDPTDLSFHFTNLRSIGFRRLLEQVAADTDSVHQAEYRRLLRPVVPDSGRFAPRVTASDSLKVKLPTIDGLYMPIHQGHVYVSSQVAFYNLTTYILGDENWADPDNLTKNYRYVPRLAFASSTTIDSTLLNQSDIQDFYSRRYDREPTNYDYLGYDAGSLLLEGLTQARFNPVVLVGVLKTMGTHRGIISQVKFGGSSPRQNQSVFIMEYDNQARELEQAGFYDQFGFHPESMVLPAMMPMDSTGTDSIHVDEVVND